jgi:uncharacterized linocin/CFP29 family protein
MPTILRREYAPISTAAWDVIDEEAKRTIERTLTCRHITDFSGPHGWELGTVNTGRVKISKGTGADDIKWGIRESVPLIEVRQPFRLNRMEIDNLTRGAEDVDLDPLTDVAAKVARFEDNVVYHGFTDAAIPGIIKSASHKPLKLPKEAEEYPQAVSHALKILTEAGIGGPYTLILGRDPYFSLIGSAKHGYPPQRVIRDMIGGNLLMSPVLAGGLVVSVRGGDFQLVVGKDYSVGYTGHTTETIEFFITESFAFRVLEPRGGIELKPEE